MIKLINEIYFFYFSTKTYNVGSQKDGLHETALLNFQTHV